MLSKSCIHGIRALTYLAIYGKGDYTSISEIAENLGISFHFLTKILRSLSANRLIASYQGPKGGIAFTKDPSDISILEVAEIIDGKLLFKTCILGLEGCGTKTPCPMHDEYSKITERTKKLFTKTNISDLAKKIVKNNLRITDVEIVL